MSTSRLLWRRHAAPAMVLCTPPHGIRPTEMRKRGRGGLLHHLDTHLPPHTPFSWCRLRRPSLLPSPPPGREYPSRPPTLIQTDRAGTRRRTCCWYTPTRRFTRLPIPAMGHPPLLFPRPPGRPAVLSQYRLLCRSAVRPLPRRLPAPCPPPPAHGHGTATQAPPIPTTTHHSREGSGLLLWRPPPLSLHVPHTRRPLYPLLPRRPPPFPFCRTS